MSKKKVNAIHHTVPVFYDMEKNIIYVENVEFSLARGSARFSIGDSDVWGGYVNGVALFCFKASWAPKTFWTCVVTGYCSCGSPNLAEALLEGVKIAKGLRRTEMDRHRISKKKFQAIMCSTERLYPTRSLDENTL